MSNEAVPTVAHSGLESKRDAAKAYLGCNWVNHPSYTFNPRHSNDRDICALARKPYFLDVSQKAASDRLANPAYLRAERYRQAVLHLH